MIYKADTNELILSTHECYCADGTQFGYALCEPCKGSGNGIRGGKLGCRNCNGNGRAISKDIILPHDDCKGTRILADTWTSRISSEAVTKLCQNILVIREIDLYHKTYRQKYSAIYETVDYGNAWASSALEIVEDVRHKLTSFPSVQACKVIEGGFNFALGKTKMKMADGLFVYVERNGMSVHPLFGG